MPVKNDTYKITIDSNKSPINLGDLFSGEFFWLGANINRNTLEGFDFFLNFYINFYNGCLGRYSLWMWNKLMLLAVVKSEVFAEGFE